MQSMSAIAEPESPAPSPIENVPAHEIAENEPQNFAEENLTLKRKLRHAVTVANGCARVLED